MHVLIIEDDSVLVDSMKRLLYGHGHCVTAVTDLPEARHTLPQGHFDAVVLDLNLPRKDGKEVLKEIDEDRELRRIPVVVLTSSEAEEDIARSYELHANAYITKPVDIDQFIDVAQNLEEFWLSIVKLPPNDD